MNYYPFHLGDYAAHTAHLDPIEDIAYRRLLDLYYLREAPLEASDDLARLIRMRGHEGVVAQVLHEFFIEDGHTWRHPRCDAEIARYQSMIEGGRKGAAKRWASPGDRGGIAPAIGVASPPQAPPNANQEPRTNNQEPEEKKKRASAPPPPEGVDQQTWTDWLALRTKKRAPVTATVIEGARREAEKAGMALGDFLAVWCTRGSQGLQADWLRPDERRFTRPAESFRQQDERAAQARWEAMTGRAWPTSTTAEVIDITAAPAPFARLENDR